MTNGRFLTSQIAIFCWANSGILSAVLLARRRQMTLTRFHFAQNLIFNRWFDVGPTPVAQQTLHYQRNANHSLSSIALGQRWPHMIYEHHQLISINIISLEILDFPYARCYWLQQFIP